MLSLVPFGHDPFELPDGQDHGRRVGKGPAIVVTEVAQDMGPAPAAIGQDNRCAAAEIDLSFFAGPALQPAEG